MRPTALLVLCFAALTLIGCNGCHRPVGRPSPVPVTHPDAAPPKPAEPATTPDASVTKTPTIPVETPKRCPKGVTPFDAERLATLVAFMCDPANAAAFESRTDTAKSAHRPCDVQVTFSMTTPDGKPVMMKHTVDHKTKRKPIIIVLWHREQPEGGYEIALDEHVGVGMEDFLLAAFRDHDANGCMDFSAGKGPRQEFHWYNKVPPAPLEVQAEWQARMNAGLESLERLAAKFKDAKKR